METKYFESLYPADSRFSEIEELGKLVREGNSVQLIGLPGVGRANLLAMLAHNRSVREKHLGEEQKWVHFVLVNFSEVKHRQLFDVMKFLFLSLTDSLRERKMEEEYDVLQKILKESLSFKDEMVLFQGLKKGIDYLAIEKKLFIVFLCDRFEEYLPRLTEEFFANMRVLRNRAKYRFSLVLSLERPLEEIVEPVLLGGFFDLIAGHHVYMRLYDAPSSNFRLAYLEKVTARKLDKACIAEEIVLTGGHWQLMKTCAETLLAEEKHGEQLEAYLLERKTVQGALRKIWQSFSPDEQTALETYMSGKSESDSRMEGYLDLIGIVKNNSVQIPLLSSYIKKYTKELQGEVKRISFDIEKNEIKKGDIDLSERLTSAEYRLLVYCLENQEKIIEREELIQAVWQEGKSTAGVTDQALDQLIFRVRKKIEDDPNNPVHLQTIKGRGIRFTS